MQRELRIYGPNSVMPGGDADRSGEKLVLPVIYHSPRDKCMYTGPPQAT